LKEISTLGWVLIAVISLIVLSSYWSLLSLVRKKNQRSDAPSWTKSWKALSNPWENEDKQLDELSRQVSNLQNLEAANKNNDPQKPPELHP